MPEHRPKTAKPASAAGPRAGTWPAGSGAGLSPAGPAVAPATARAVMPNAGIEAWYARNLGALVRHMAKVAEREILAAWPARGLAQDAKPGDLLDATFENLLDGIFGRMTGEFDQVASLIAEKLGRKMTDYTRRNVTAALKEAGFTVEMRLTAREAAIMQNVIQENVALIKSIPALHHERVREAVRESVAKGRDLHGLTEALKKEDGITQRRAAMIARDQNNKATEALTRARYQELGLTRAIWMHRSGGKVPRPTHRAMNGVEFDLNEGLFDATAVKRKPPIGRNIQPGELVNCHCTMKPVLPRPALPADPVSGGMTSAAMVLEKAA